MGLYQKLVKTSEEGRWSPVETDPLTLLDLAIAAAVIAFLVVLVL